MVLVKASTTTHEPAHSEGLTRQKLRCGWLPLDAERSRSIGATLRCVEHVETSLSKWD